MNYIIFDVANVVWRSAHSQYRKTEQHLGVYGFLYEILETIDTVGTNKDDVIIFAFDHNDRTHRRKYLPDYKEKTRYQDDAIRGQVNRTIDDLRIKFLPKAGFTNIFHVPGYEADDIIAVIVKREVKPEDTCFIISNDSDLHQLLSRNCTIFSRSKGPVTMEWFTRKYKLDPSMVPRIKALAGDPSDNIKGIPRVGLVTAIAYLRGLTKSVCRHVTRFIETEEGERYYKNATKVCTLPCVDPETSFVPVINKRERILLKDWNNLCDELGFKRLKRTEHQIIRGSGKE